MKRLLATLLVVAALAMPTLASAGGPTDEYDDSQSHPLRIAAYVVHPVGYATEWLIFRPLHYLVAQPGLEQVFGHQSHDFYYAFDSDER